MAISTELVPIDEALIVRMTGTPAERSQMLATFAREQLALVLVESAIVLAHVPAFIRIVDGVVGALEDAVRPDGEIEYDFDADGLGQVLAFIFDQLEAHSPVGGDGDRHPGLYRSSHQLFADGVPVDPDAELPDARQFVFVNTTAYARPIERGESSQAPDGVYEAVAALASAQYGDRALIRFTFQAIDGGGLVAAPRGDRAAARAAQDLRMPAIIVSARLN